MQVSFESRRIVNLDNYPPQGKFIYQRLSEIGKNQTWLSQSSGIAQGNLSMIISGKALPTLKTAIKIASTLDVSLDDFAFSFM